MKHLTPAEIVDSLEGTLPPDRERHARGCDRCRREVDRAAAALRELRAVDAPEPSPLFWDAFGARVRDSIREERPRRGLPRWAWVPATAAVLVAIATGATWLRLRVQPARQPQTQTASIETSGAPVAPATPAADAPGAEWAFITGVADDLEWDPVDVPGMDLRPGAAEDALPQLTDDQRQELARLLRLEIDRRTSS